jgi:hydrogenase small subunit
MSSITVGEFLRSRGVTRRDFLRFCTATTVALGLPATMAPRVAAALEQARRIARGAPQDWAVGDRAA